MEDHEIVELYWRRDEEAIRASQAKYGGYCLHIAGGILADRQDAEECVSDTLHSAWNAIPPQRPGSLPAFLGRIVRNLSISRRRRERARKRFSGLDVLLSELEECLPSPGGVEDTVEGRELTGRIEDWLDGLGREDRVIFMRRYWYGDEVQALARAHGVGPNQMSKRLLRLREGLKRELEREGYM